MADKKNKKPRHQNLFVPGESKPKKQKKGSSAPKEHPLPVAPVRAMPPAMNEARGEESLYKQREDGLFGTAGQGLAPAMPADAPRPAPQALAEAAQAKKATPDQLPGLFGGEGQLLEEAGAAGAPGKAEEAAGGPAASAGAGLAQGHMFDDDDGLVLSGMAAPAAPAGVSAGQSAAKAAPGKKEKKGKKPYRKKQTTALEELRGTDPWGKQAEGAPQNTVLMPRRKKTRLSAARRRKLWRRIKRVAFVAVAAVLVLFYTTGTYLAVATYVAEAFDTVRIAAKGGDGFPLEFGLAKFLRAEPMGEGGTFVLGEGEAAIISSNGAQQRYLQHSYLNPGVAAGKNRAVLYSRGGREYTVESRSKTVVKNTTEQEVLFCAMSPDGWLGVVTSSRYRANLQVLAPPYDAGDPLFSWPLVDDKPVALAFHSDNKSMVLGCLSAQNGALGTTLYLLRTDKSAVQAEIRADNATLLQLRYLDNHRVLAIYDTYAATYNSKGQELNRYDYAHRRLLTANIYDGRTALVFGTTSGEDAHTVLLDRSLEPQFDVLAQTLGHPRVMAVPNGVYLLAGQTLYAYTGQGALAARTEYEDKLLGLAYAGAPLLVEAKGLTPIADMLRETPIEAAPSLPPSDTGAPASVPLPTSVPDGLYQAPPDISGVASSLPGEEDTPADGEPAGEEPPP